MLLAPSLLTTQKPGIAQGRYSGLQRHHADDQHAIQYISCGRGHSVRTDAAAEGGEKDLESRKAGRSTYRPNSYTEIVDDAVASIVYAIEDKINRMEVEFPAVSETDGYKGSSDLYIDTNIQLAVAAARKIFSTTAMKVHILVPDEPEYRRAYKLYVLLF